MTETEHKEPMFYVGAQGTPDGDMLPKSFTVFSPLIDQQQAVMIVIKKITEELAELDIDDSDGTVVIQPICNWQEFADLEVDDHIKMIALGTAVTGMFMTMLSYSSEKVAPLIGRAWTPQDD